MPAILLDGGPLRVWNLIECQRKLGITPGGGINQLTGDVTAGPGTGSQVATIAPAAVTLAKLQDFNTDKLIGRDTAGTGPAEAIGVTGGIEFTGTQNIQIADDGVTYAKMQNISAASRLLGRGSAAGAGDPQEITLGPGLSMVGTVLDAPAPAGGITQLTGDVTAGPGSGSQAATIANAAVTDAKLRNSAALSVIGRASDTAGTPADIAAVENGFTVLQEFAGVLRWNKVATAFIDDNAINDQKLRTGTARSVIGRGASTGGNVADITAANGSGTVLRENGGTIGFGTIDSTGLTNNAVTDFKLRDAGPLSVIGRSGNTTGDPADISATAASGAVLRESGSVLGFGTIVAAGIATDAVTTIKIANDNVTNAKLANMATATIKGRVTVATGDPEDLTGTQVTALLNAFTSLLQGLVPASGGGTANFLRADGTFATPPNDGGITQLVTDVIAGPGTGTQAAIIANQAVTNAKMLAMPDKTFKGNNAGGSSSPQDLTVAAVKAMLGMSKQTEVDFGTTPVSEALFTVTDADVSPTSRLVGTVAYEAPTGKDLDELDMDGLDLKFGPGSGQFTVYVRGMDGYIADKFKLNYIVG